MPYHDVTELPPPSISKYLLGKQPEQQQKIAQGRFPATVEPLKSAPRGLVDR